MKTRTHRTTAASADPREGLLVEQAQNGSHEAFAELYDTHRPFVLGFLRKHYGSSEAEDLVADVFASAWISLPNFTTEAGSFRSWLLGIARHRAANSLRSSNRRMSRELRAHLEHDDAIVDPTQHADRLLMLRDALCLLSDRERTVIELRYFEDQSVDAVADRMDISPSSVRHLQRRAIERMRRMAVITAIALGVLIGVSTTIARDTELGRVVQALLHSMLHPWS